MREGANGACCLHFSTAKRGGAFSPDMPAGLWVRVPRFSGFTRPCSGVIVSPSPQLEPQIYSITGDAATSRSRSSPILMGWWFERCVKGTTKRRIIVQARAASVE
jgi:hypothetical protein